MTPKLDPLLGLHFRSVLGDALCDERGLARRLSRVTRRSSRHRVRPELVHLLRDLSGATVPSRVGRGDDIARSTHLLRPAGHGSIRSRHAGRAADLGAMGRQHHRGASTISEVAKRSSSRSTARSRPGRCSQRHIRPAQPRWSCSRATRIRSLNALMRIDLEEVVAADGRHVGDGGVRTLIESGHAVERGDPGNVGRTNAWRRARGPSPSCCRS